MNLRILRCSVAALVFFISLGPASADPLDDAIHSAEALRDSLQNNFTPYVRSLSTSGVHSSYLLGFVDHYSAREILRQRANDGSTSVTKLGQRFEVLYEQLSPNSPTWEADAVEALALIAQLQRHHLEAQQIKNDAKELQESWRSQCRNDLTHRMNQFYNPLSSIPILEPGTVQAIRPELHMGFSVSSDLSSGSVNAAAPPFQAVSNDYEGAWVSIGSGLLYCGPIGVIAGGIMLGLYALYKLIPFGLASAAAGNKQGQLYQLQQDIRDTQYSSLKTVAAEMPHVIDQACHETFTAADADNLYLQDFEAYASQAAELFADSQSKGQDIIAQAKARYEALDQTYYPAVAANYRNLIEQRFEQDVKTDQQIRDLLRSVFQPLVDHLQNTTKTGGVSLWEDEQRIWSAMIDTDSIYRTREGFSFGSAKNASSAVRFDNYWNYFGPKLQGVMP
jgi:hypothetical protein